MMQSLLKLITNHRQLLVEHAEAYAELAVSEAVNVSAAWKRQAILSASALCSLVVAAVLAGVALMLWALMPGTHLQAPWVLLVAPLLPLAVAVGCWLAARKTDGEPLFANLRRQFEADKAVLREVRAA